MCLPLIVSIFYDFFAVIKLGLYLELLLVILLKQNGSQLLFFGLSVPLSRSCNTLLLGEKANVCQLLYLWVITANAPTENNNVKSQIAELPAVAF